jgi:hypothetical protein
MTNPRGDTLPKRDVVVDENFFVSTVIKVALLGIPKVCPNVIGYIASLYVDNLFHGWLRIQQGCRLERLERQDRCYALEEGVKAQS